MFARENPRRAMRAIAPITDSITTCAVHAMCDGGGGCPSPRAGRRARQTLRGSHGRRHCLPRRRRSAPSSRAATTRARLRTAGRLHRPRRGGRAARPAPQKEASPDCPMRNTFPGQARATNISSFMRGEKTDRSRFRAVQGVLTMQTRKHTRACLRGARRRCKAGTWLSMAFPRSRSAARGMDKAVSHAVISCSGVGNTAPSSSPCAPGG